jgi:hypothetical protein
MPHRRFLVIDMALENRQLRQKQVTKKTLIASELGENLENVRV